MNQILAMAAKDIRLLVRDKAGLFFVVVFPFIYAMLIGAIFSTGASGGAAFQVVGVDEDATAGSRQFLDELGALDQVDVETLPLDQAADRVRRGEAVAYIVLKTGFGAARENPFASGPPVVEITADPARGAERAMLQGMLMEIGFRSTTELFANPEKRNAAVQQGFDGLAQRADNPEMARERGARFLSALRELDELTRDTGNGNDGASALFQPLRFESNSIVRQRRGPDNAYEYSIPQGIAWAMLFCLQRFATSLVAERVSGTLTRMQMAPVSRTQILAGKALACVVLMAAVSADLVLFAVVALDVRIASIPLLLLAMGCAILSFTGIMAAMSTLGRTEAAAAGAGSAIMLVMAMTGGGAVPLLAMPQWMQTVGSVSPVKWAILAIEGAIWREFSPVEMLTPCVILLAIGVACFYIGVRTFRWHE